MQQELEVDYKIINKDVALIEFNGMILISLPLTLSCDKPSMQISAGKS